ncbi:hypothetical protein [Sporomusa aerivorans]|uniref:hypothetical protein n=1 Tax=Sporomusa aerivorans TaxID=204936 RepID=UPI00352B127E
MARTFSCNEEIIVVSKGTEDIGKLAMLGNDGKFDPSVIPDGEKNTAVCRVSRSVDQSIPNTVATKVVFDSVEFDSDNMYNTTNPTRITIPSDGVYQIVAQIIYNSQGTGYRAASIMLNGSINLSGQSSVANGTNTWGGNVGSINKLQTGDYVELQAFQISGGALNVINDSAQGRPFLAIFKVSD